MNNHEVPDTSPDHAGGLSLEASVPYLGSLAAAMRLRMEETLGTGVTISAQEAEHWKALFQVADPRVVGEDTMLLVGVLDSLIVFQRPSQDNQ